MAYRERITEAVNTHAVQRDENNDVTEYNPAAARYHFQLDGSRAPRMYASAGYPPIDSLCIHGLAPDFSRANVFELLRQVTLSAKPFVIVLPRVPDGKDRYAMVKFDSIETEASVMIKVNKATLTGTNRKLRASYAKRAVLDWDTFNAS